MAAVVHKFMHVHALEDVGRALFGADKIDAEQQQKAGKDDPRERFAERNRSGSGSWRGM
jgi:hypothetical protein